MNAVMKVAWMELVVSVLAIMVALAMYPWAGEAALAGFAVLGILGFTPLILRQRGNRVVRDERDDEIEQRSASLGFGAAWTATLLLLTIVTVWHGYHERDVPTGLLSVVIWAQFALCFAIKGAASLIQYRGVDRAA